MKKESNTEEPNLNVTLNHYPLTWPTKGPIDLAVHDLPHHESVIEWWYQNCHVTSTDGRKFSLFASFFRLATGKDKHSENCTYAHSVIWSLSDVEEKKYYMDSLVDPDTPVHALKIMKKNEESSQGSKSIRRAIKEVYEKGNIPLPDRLLKNHAKIGNNNFSLEYDENSFKKDASGNYQLQLQNPVSEVACRLTFVPLTEPVRHGNNGLVGKVGRGDMFYYFIPKCGVSGEIQIGSNTYKVEGNGWYDHQFSRPADETTTFEFKGDMAWNWISLQLDNGCQISGYDLFDNTDNGKHVGGTMIIIDADGKIINEENYSFFPEYHWTSSRTFMSYPVSWRLEIPTQNIFLSITADFAEQEFVTILSAPAFWEGRVNASGSFMVKEVSGAGYVEINGFDTKESIESFLKAIGKATQRATESLLPVNPTDDQFHRLVNSPLGIRFFTPEDKEQYVSSVIKPIREVVDRNKKAWRSYVFLASIDIVGGNSQPFIDWLAMPELIHTGSLIVDDVQDKSDTRRGGMALHHLYGEPLAINAGNVCYFVGELFTHTPQLPENIRLKVYELFFEMMRAAHAGQAMDISGLHSLMPDAVSTGSSSSLEKRIYTIHRLKTAAPACTLVKMGGLIGNGKHEEIEALCNFFDAIGVAYQIMDDVLNLQGFDGDLKDKGEDITAGKITMPVAKAMSLLPLDKREYVWKTIQAMPTDKTTIESVIIILQNCGAIEACRLEAEKLLETAWKHVDEVFPDSFFKVRLRAFGWFVLQKG